jgi:hypothetical protein
MRQKDYIFAIGYYFLRIAFRHPDMSTRDPLAINILTDIIYLLTVVSLAVLTYHIIKRKNKGEDYIWLLYLIFFISILVWATGGPDIRFVSGVLCATIFTGGIILTKSTRLPFLGKTISLLFITGIFTWNSYNLYSFSSQTHNSNIISHIAYKPYSVINQKRAQGIVVEKDFSEYLLNNGVTILVSSGFSYDIFPSTIHSTYAKFLPIDYLEARGYSFQDGFKTKETANMNHKKI